MASAMERPQSPSATPAPIAFKLAAGSTKSQGTNGVAPIHRPVARSEPTSPAISSLSMSSSNNPALALGRPEPPPPDFGIFASRSSGPGNLQDLSASTITNRPVNVGPPSQSIQVSRSVPASPASTTSSRMPLGSNWAAPPPLDLHTGSARVPQQVSDVPIRPMSAQGDSRMQHLDPRLQQPDPRSAQLPDPRRSMMQGPSSVPVTMMSGNWSGWNPGMGGSAAPSVVSIGDRDDASVASIDEVSMYGAESHISSATAAYTRELSEGRIKLLREDNQMLRENLRREQQAREDIAKLMREECAALAKRVKDEYEQRAAAQSELDALRDQTDAVHARSVESEQELERKEKLSHHLRERVEVLEGKLDAKEEELEQFKGRMQSLEQSVREETSRGDQERARADKTWEELTEARDKCRRLAAELNDEQEEVKNGRMEIDRLKSDLHLSELRQADELDHQRRELESSHADRMQEVLDENAAKMEEQLSRNAKMHDEFSRTMADQREVEGSADTMRSKLVAVSEELHRVNEENHQLKHRSAQLQGELAAVQAAASHLRSDHDAPMFARISSSDLSAMAAGPPASPRRGLPPSAPSAPSSSLLDSVRQLQPQAQVAPRAVRPPPEDPSLRRAPPPQHQHALHAAPPPHPGSQGPLGVGAEGALPGSFQGTPSDSLQGAHHTPHGSYHAPSPHNNSWYNPPPEPQPQYPPPPRMVGQRAPSPMLQHTAPAFPPPGLPPLHAGPPPPRYDAGPAAPPPHWQGGPPPMGMGGPMGGAAAPAYSGVGLHELTPEQIWSAGYDPNTVIGV